MREPGVQHATLNHQAVSHQNILVGDYLCTLSESRSHLLLQFFLLLSRCDDVVTKPEIHTAERTCLLLSANYSLKSLYLTQRNMK